MAAELLEKVIARLDQLPADELERLQKQYTAKKPIWLPTVGPQFEAYYSPANELLYGGAGGGGKSELGLGLAFTAHKKSLILRRQYVDLGGMTDRAIEINGSRDGFSGAIPMRLRTKDDRMIIFGAHKDLGDEQSWQGQPFDFKCVAGHTPIRMADGSYRPIRSIRVGDWVDTLEGARVVRRVLPVRRDRAVRVTVRGFDGRVVCSQDQSLTHEVLTRQGWASHSGWGKPSPSSKGLPTQFGAFSAFCRLFARRSASQLRPSVWIPLASRRAYAGFQHFLRLVGRLAKCAFGAAEPLASGFGASGGIPQGRPLPLLWFSPLGRRSRFRQLYEYLYLERTSDFHSGDARFSSIRPNWQGHCLWGSRQYGGHAPQSWHRAPVEGGDLVCLLPQGDAEQPSPSGSEDDGQGRIPKRSLRINTYAHPYTKEIRQVSPDRYACSLSFCSQEIGTIDLFDIEVDEVNHYITAGGIVNKNCFDEACQHLEVQVQFHLGWLRSASPGQRCRAILASNPPIDASGDWMIKRYRPWLDLTHDKPAKGGELRWFITNPDGEDQEVDGPTPLEFTHKGEKKTYLPKSRTFIPAALKDNPFLIASGYQATLDALPEPLRSAVRDGNFMASRMDPERQVIPSQWVIEAQARWTKDGKRGKRMTALGYDPAGGGADPSALARRYGHWYDELVLTKGAETADGSLTVAHIFTYRRDGAEIVIDTGGGYAGQTILRLRDNDADYTAFNGNSEGPGRDKSGQLRFANLRAKAWWKFREALDPDQDGGSPICLPPDQQLRAELTAPTYTAQRMGIQIESKDDIRRRIGRSTNRADAVVMAWDSAEDSIKRRDSLGLGRRALPTHAKTTRKGALQRRRGY